MMRVLLYVLGVLLIVLITWVVFISVDEVVPFARLELTTLRIDGRRAPQGEGQAAQHDGRVFVSFSWRAHTSGARCVRVRDDVKVAVGGEPARAVHLGGGAWVIGDVLPLPFHRCVNQAVYEVERALRPGIVATSLGDGRGNPALMSALDVVAPPSLVVTSPQPARAGERATLAALPDTLAIARQPLVQRDGVVVWPVDVEENRMSFAVPRQWAPGDAAVRVATDRLAPVLRCERAPVCFAFGVPVDDEVPFGVVAPSASGADAEP